MNPLKKPKSTRYIKYSEPNQEDKKTRQSKVEMRLFLKDYGYEIIKNAEKGEFALPLLTNEFGKGGRYQLDMLAYNTMEGDLICIEIDGDSHRRSKLAIANTRLKRELVTEYFKKRLIIPPNLLQDNKVIGYFQFRYFNFDPDEIVGKYKNDYNFFYNKVIKSKTLN